VLFGDTGKEAVELQDNPTIAGARVLKGLLRDVLIAMVKANELAGRTDVALVYLRELMMHTKEAQQGNALQHHRLQLKQLDHKQQTTPTPDALVARRGVKLRDRLFEQVAHQEVMKSRIEMLERLVVTAELILMQMRGMGGEQRSDTRGFNLVAPTAARSPSRSTHHPFDFVDIVITELAGVIGGLAVRPITFSRGPRRRRWRSGCRRCRSRRAHLRFGGKF
jgi:hypothetical protein